MGDTIQGLLSKPGSVGHPSQLALPGAAAGRLRLRHCAMLGGRQGLHSMHSVPAIHHATLAERHCSLLAGCSLVRGNTRAAIAAVGTAVSFPAECT
jgi:hypothetical protein